MDGAPSLAPDDVIDCPPLRCRMRVRWCLERHTKVIASGAARGFPEIPECWTCADGAAFLRRCPTFAAPAPSMPPVVLPPAQRAARNRWALEHLDEPRGAELDPFAEVAMASPDDRGIIVDAG